MISWTAGPPPVEWRDGRDVLVLSRSVAKHVNRFGASSATWFGPDDAHASDGGITYHAALEMPDLANVSRMG